MWYIYQQDNQWTNSTTEPEQPHVTVKRMPPKPVKPGYSTTLMANFETNTVWWELTQTEEGKATEIRTQRDALLTACDWTQTLDAPIDTDSQTAYRTYRQALRDMTEQADFPYTVEWPWLPTVVKADPDPVDTAIDALLDGNTESEVDE